MSEELDRIRAKAEARLLAHQPNVHSGYNGRTSAKALMAKAMAMGRRIRAEKIRGRKVGKSP